MKLGPHGILTTYGGLAWAKRAHIVKQVNGTDLLRAAPDGAIRVFRRTWDVQSLHTTAADIAGDIITALGSYRHPLLYVEVYNEQFGRLNQGLEQYVLLLSEVTALLHAEGLKVAGPSWATGDYDAADWAYLRSHNWCGLDAIALHCYWAGAGFTAWNALRYRSFWRPGDPPILITECGRDKVRDGDTRVNGGWIGNGGWIADGLSPEQYVQELIAYDAEICRDAYVLRAALFTAGPTNDWQPYNTDGIAGQLATLAETQPPEPPAQPPKPDSVPPDQEAQDMTNPYIEWVRAGGDGTIARYAEHRANFGDSKAKAVADILKALMADDGLVEQIEQRIGS